MFKSNDNRLIIEGFFVASMSSNGAQDIPKIDTESNVRSVHENSLDLTERKKAEAALRDSEERYAQLSKAAFEGIIISRGGIILDANTQFASMMGYEIEELIGKLSVDLVVPKSREIVLEKMLAGYEGLYEFFCIRKDGTVFPVEVR